MRDGVSLSTDIYLPSEGDRFPVLLERTYYGNSDSNEVARALEFVCSGYAVVLQDCRGRYDSAGEWDPYNCEATDGYDTHEWIGAQSWCAGKIGTFGGSYNGFTQTSAAPLRSKYLKALVPIASQQDNYGHHRVDGVVQLMVSMFFMNMTGRTLQREATSQLDLDSLYARLPLISALDDICDSSYYRGVISNETCNEWWTRYSLKDRYESVDAPALFITGWYDSLLHETFKLFSGWTNRSSNSEARRLTKLIIGPWGHQTIGGRDFGPLGRFGDRFLGPSATLNLTQEHLRWFDARLRAVDSGIDREPPIRIFVMGINQWRSEREWPLDRSKFVDWYLRSDGAANSESGDGALSPEGPHDSPPDRFNYHPGNPIPTWGGPHQHRDRSGPRDRREIETRPDVLVYTSEPLRLDLEVTGPVSATVFAATSGADTDFTCTLADVEPSGKAIHICEGIRRGRLRNGFDRPTPIEPGGVYEYKIDMWETSNVFKAGHRIRVEVSSSNFPRFERNLNTLGRPGFGTDIRSATQTVFHDPLRPSHITLPLVPAS